MKISSPPFLLHVNYGGGGCIFKKNNPYTMLPSTNAIYPHFHCCRCISRVVHCHIGGDGDDTRAVTDDNYFKRACSKWVHKKWVGLNQS